MKVALISHEGGGISSVAQGIGHALAKKKIYTKIFTGAYSSTPRTVNINQYLEIAYLPTVNFAPKPLWFQAINAKMLLKSLANYSVVHGVSPDASFALSFFKKKIGKPFITTIHDPTRTRQKLFLSQPFSTWTLREFAYCVLEFPLHNYINKRVISNSNHVTFCSNYLRNEISTYNDLDFNSTSVIYNGVDFDEIESMNHISSENSSNLRMVYAGRLFWSKGVMLLLQAFDRIKRDLRNVNLEIFGKGPLESKINKFILKSGLKNRIKLKGYVQRKELLVSVKKSDMIVFPSLSEAQSMFMLEAMACKKPVIAFDLPFASEIMIDRKTGLLAKAGDIVDLSEKIKMLVQDKQLRERIGETAYRYVKEHHNWDKQVTKYLKLYDALDTNIDFFVH